MTAPAEILPWDSEFFGLRVARALDTETFGPGTGRALVEWCRAERVGWLYALLPPTPTAIQEAEASAFALTDVRIELAGPPDRVAAGPVGPTRPVRDTDLPALRRLARVSHTDSRFFSDPNVPDGQAARLFESWIERDCAVDNGGWVGVVDAGGRPSGYVTARLDDQRQGWIGLIAVAAEARGRGLGAALVAEAGRWLSTQGAHDVRVVTQGRNLAAQRLYQQAGFRTASVRLWYHRWFGS